MQCFVLNLHSLLKLLHKGGELFPITPLHLDMCSLCPLYSSYETKIAIIQLRYFWREFMTTLLRKRFRRIKNYRTVPSFKDQIFVFLYWWLSTRKNLYSQKNTNKFLTIKKLFFFYSSLWPRIRFRFKVSKNFKFENNGIFEGPISIC